MDHIVANDPGLMAEVCQLLKMEVPTRASSICRVRDGRLLGGVIYHNKFGTTSIQAHHASTMPHWLNRRMLYAMFAYPFLQLGVQRLFGMVPADQPKVLDYDKHLGFREVGRIEGMYQGDVACVVLRMDREECRFLNVQPRSIKLHSQLRVA